MTKTQKIVEAAILEIRNEAKELPIDGSFSQGSRGHLLITIDNVLIRLGFEPGYMSGESGEGRKT